MHDATVHPVLTPVATSRAHVEDVTFYGHDALAHLVLPVTGEGPSRVTARTVAPLHPGDEVSIRIIGPALAYPLDGPATP